MNKRLLLIIILIWFNLGGGNDACTSAIISGKATPDGRPILWKHRDTESLSNQIVYFDQGKYDFLGVINSQDMEHREVWMGSNETGFSIINTASYNLDEEDRYYDKMDQEGVFMKQALAECSSLKEFEIFLNNTAGKRGVVANFGVIDALGGAAYYETGPFTYTKYDVNDSLVAPEGYLIRTNYSLSGNSSEGYGFIRYQTMENSFFWARLEKKLSCSFILNHATRCLKNSLLENDLLKNPLPEDTLARQWIPFYDYIVRSSSASSMIIQGVKGGQDPRLTTLWTIIGFQLTTVAFPLWVAAGPAQPQLLTADNHHQSILNQASLKLKQKMFPLVKGSGPNYIDRSYIANQQNSGIYQKISRLEPIITEKTYQIQQLIEIKGFDAKLIQEHYRWCDDIIRVFYRDSLGIKM